MIVIGIILLFIGWVWANIGYSESVGEIEVVIRTFVLLFGLVLTLAGIVVFAWGHLP